MVDMKLPDDCAKKWEVLLLLIASEEKKIDRTNDDEIDTMNYFLKNQGVKHILLEWLHEMQSSYSRKTSETESGVKSDAVSLHWRQRGNEAFRAGRHEDSYKCYTKSVLFADQAGVMYPLALANRSASLLNMKRFQECLEDIKLAMKAGYPSELRHKLMLRRCDCYIELNQRTKAAEALADAAHHAKGIKLTLVQTAELERHLKMLERKMDAVAEVEPPPSPPALPPPGADDLPPLLGGDNKHFVNASNILQLRRSETVGRMVVTVEATRRGDVLFSEEPYAWVPLPCELQVCDGCCATQINIVPCSVCSRTVYCNEECRARAQVYHQYECVGAQADVFPTIGIAHLALRVLLISAINEFPPVPPEHPAPTSGSALFRAYSAIDNIDIYSEQTPAFYRMFNLVTNFDKMNNMDYIQYALTAVMLTLYLEHFTSFFEYLSKRVPCKLARGQLHIFSAAVLLRALGQLVCNGHAALTLATIDDGDGNTVSECEIRRATAIYPSAAMMNHSCDPNIINTFYKCRLIVRGGRDLTPGSQVLNCYGPHRARDTTSRRRHQLRAQYLFTCSCTACLDIERRDFVLLFTAYACSSCKGPIVRSGRRSNCPQCHASFLPQKVINILDEADGLQAQAERAPTLNEQIDKRLAALRLRQQVCYRHHEGLRRSADILARLYADNGDFNKSVELIKQNIQSLEYQFGSFSVEVAHELRKLSDVMLERIIKSPQNPEYRDWCLETHKIIKKAFQLMELNYGSWEEAVRRLKEQETLVASLVAESRTPDAGDDVHHNLHYNLKI